MKPLGLFKSAWRSPLFSSSVRKIPLRRFCAQAQVGNTEDFFLEDLLDKIPRTVTHDALHSRWKRHKEVSQEIEEYFKAEKSLGDPEYLRKIKEQSVLTHAFELYESLMTKQSELQEIEELVKTETDPEMLKLASEEIEVYRKSIRETEKSALQYLLPEDKDDCRNAILECRAAAGGDEASIFTEEIFQMYEKYAILQGWRFEVLTVSAAEGKGFKEASAIISGENVFSKLKYETGGHRVQRIPSTESNGRVHTSTATVAVLPEAESVDVDFNLSDCRVDTFRASGAGGQHVNTTDSAVRITHLPSGIVVSIQDERTQHSNKAKAIKIIKSRLYQIQKEKIESEHSELRKEQIGSGERSDRIRTYNYQQNRVTDHRVNESKYGVETMMNGGFLDDFSELMKNKGIADYIRRIS